MKNSRFSGTQIMGILKQAARVVRSLEQIIEWRGAPEAIRVDNGPEYISKTMKEWAEKRGIVDVT